MSGSVSGGRGVTLRNFMIDLLHNEVSGRCGVSPLRGVCLRPWAKTRGETSPPLGGMEI